MWEMDYDAAANYWMEKDKASKQMPDSLLKERIQDFLTTHNTCALATASEDMVRCTPIEYNKMGIYTKGE